MWPEVEKARAENRHELVLGGADITERLKKDGLDLTIFQLTGLNYLDMHETCLEHIPDGVSQLTHLQSLVLNSNKLQAVNPNIAKLVKLKLLDLSKNQLPEVPDILNNLPEIVTLNFNYNQICAFPALSKTQKLAVLDLSNNKLAKFPNVCNTQLANLSELKLSDNEIEVIPPEIGHLPALKLLELGHNKIANVPGELADCTKLKDLKNNPIGDRRLFKLIDQCRTKQIMDYVKAHCAKTAPAAVNSGTASAAESDSDDNEYKHTITVHYAKDNSTIIIDESVKPVREFIVACLITNVGFTDTTFKKFIQIQNKLHETVCAKRSSSTIATHDFNKLPPGGLQYTTLPPNELHIMPLNRTTLMSGSDLFARLQNEANNLRKEKKRNTYSGIHKYLYLIEGRSRYPCLLNSEGNVISFPPITNSDTTKIDLNTKNMLVEVTGSVSLHLCKAAMDSLLKETVLLFGDDLDVTQIKTTDSEGNLKVVYPSKTDLNFNDIKVVRD